MPTGGVGYWGTNYWQTGFWHPNYWGGPGSPLITPPLVVFIAPLRQMAVTSTIDVMTFTAPARAMAVTSVARGGG